MLREHVIEFLIRAIEGRKCKHPTRVAIDGIDAAGKTTLADEIAAALKIEQRFVIRASIDSFHRPKKDRYLHGALSPEGYYQDSFDSEAIKQCLLKPLGPGGTREYRTTVFDFRKDSPSLSPVMHAPDDAVLLFDGVFLLRPELKDYWDFRIFVHIDFDVSLQRTLIRDLSLFSSKQAIVERYEKRYMPGQKIYLRQVKPQTIADIVINNNDPQNPIITGKSMKIGS